jgi:bifunctional aspartokinase / homoserine dehydrogenase 1
MEKREKIMASPSLRNNLLVMKFGGTSVGTVEALRSVISIVETSLKEWPECVVVVSALSGITNKLLDSASMAANGDDQTYLKTAAELVSRHFEMMDAFLASGQNKDALKNEILDLVNDFKNICQAVVVLGEATPRALDTVAGFGERLSARVLAAALSEHGIPSTAVDATRLIVTDANFQSAAPEFLLTTEKTRSVLLPLLKKGLVVVATGFIAATREGILTTLGRGGSDYSAAILGAVLPAGEVWIWTDVDGVMTADPRLVPDARTIPELTFREVGELAYFGAKVLHPKTIRPVIDMGIGLRVCNTFSPEKPGTYLVAERKHNENGVVKAITAVRGLQLITVEGRGMLGVPGVAARTFKAVAHTGTSVPLISQASSEQSICFAVPQESTQSVIKAVEEEFSLEILRKDIDRVWATAEVVIMTVVGEGMRNIPGIAGRVFGALGENRINVIAIAQGSSEVSISMVLDADDTLHATRALHELIKHSRG